MYYRAVVRYWCVPIISQSIFCCKVMFIKLCILLLLSLILTILFFLFCSYHRKYLYQSHAHSTSLTSMQILPDVIIQYAKCKIHHLVLDWLSNNIVFYLIDLYKTPGEIKILRPSPHSTKLFRVRWRSKQNLCQNATLFKWRVMTRSSNLRPPPLALHNWNAPLFHLHPCRPSLAPVLALSIKPVIVIFQLMCSDMVLSNIVYIKQELFYFQK